MHPIFGSRRRLLLYLLAWTPILALLAYVTRSTTGVSWRDACAVLAPACLVYAFLCLSSWYICRARPLRPANAVSLLVTFALAASVESLLLAGSAWGAA